MTRPSQAAMACLNRRTGSGSASPSRSALYGGTSCSNAMSSWARSSSSGTRLRSTAVVFDARRKLPEIASSRGGMALERVIERSVFRELSAGGVAGTKPGGPVLHRLEVRVRSAGSLGLGPDALVGLLQVQRIAMRLRHVPRCVEV